MPSFTDIVTRKYDKPVRPYSFGSPAAVQRYYRDQGISVKKEKVQKALAHTDAYALHREYHKPKVFNAFYVYKKRAMVQADLVMLEDARQNEVTDKNDGIRYLLTAIGEEYTN